MNIDNIEISEHVKIISYAFLRKMHLISKNKFIKKYEKYFSKIKNNIFQQVAPLNKLQGVINNETKNLRGAARGALGILTAPHTEFIARCICDVLYTLNIRNEIFFDYQANDDDEMFYIVISPDYFSHGLPKNYFVFNTEQFICDNSPTEDLLAMLRNSYGVLDCSLKNIEFLNTHTVNPGKLFYTKLFPRPVKVLDFESKTTPILFYGELCPQKKEILERLSLKFPIKIMENLICKERRKELDKAKIILNISTDENAMLETTRLCEAMSHGCLVISERGVNNKEYPELEELVDFVDIDDVDALEKRFNTGWTIRNFCTKS